MPILDTTAVAAVLKTQYTQKKVQNLVYKQSPLFAMIPKRKDFYGDSKVISVQIGNPQAAGHNFAVAQANLTPTTYKKFVVTRVRDYIFANLATEAVDAASNDQGSLLTVMKREFDNAFYTMGRRINTALFQKGGGLIGQIRTGGISGSTITLADPNQIVNFEIGMVLNLATTDGTTGAKRTGTLTVAGVNRDSGVITTSVAVTTGIPAAAALDFIFQNGDFEATNQGLAGIAAWVPKTAPTTGDNFYGLDRSIDSRLYGLRYTAGSGGPIEETLIQAAAKLAREGGTPDVAVMNPLDLANLVVALGSKVIYDRSTAVDNPDFGFKTLVLIGPGGPIKVIGDLNVQTGDCWLLQTDTWCFETLKDGPRILDLDGLQMLRSANSDDYQFRIGWYGNLTCTAPGWNMYVQL